MDLTLIISLMYVNTPKYTIIGDYKGIEVLSPFGVTSSTDI